MKVNQAHIQGKSLPFVKPVSLAGITKSERLYGTDRRPNTIKMRRKKQVT